MPMYVGMTAHRQRPDQLFFVTLFIYSDPLRNRKLTQITISACGRVWQKYAQQVGGFQFQTGGVDARMKQPIILVARARRRIHLTRRRYRLPKQNRQRTGGNAPKAVHYASRRKDSRGAPTAARESPSGTPAAGQHDKEKTRLPRSQRSRFCHISMRAGRLCRRSRQSSLRALGYPGVLLRDRPEARKNAASRSVQFSAERCLERDR